MKFNIVYRNNGGQQERLQIDAENRAVVFAELQKRGISAIRVEDASGKAKPAPPVPSARKPSPFRGFFAGLLVIALAVAAWYYLLPTIEQVKSKKYKKPSRIADVAPKIAKQATEREKMASNSRDKSSATSDASSASDDSALDNAVEESTEPTKPHPIFKTPTDQLIWLAVFASNGASVPPLPRIDRADTDRFIESLNRPLVIEPDDPPHIQAMKEKISDVRKAILDKIMQNPDKELFDILNEHREEFNANLNLYADAKKEYDEIIAQGDEEGAEVYRVTANAFLEQLGANLIEPDDDDDESVE